MNIKIKKARKPQMRKKVLLNQNIALFDQLQKAKGEIMSLKSELEKKDEIIAQLTKKISDKESVVSPEISDEATLPVIDERTDYASSVIGKIVLVATEKSNELSLRIDGSGRELINLILGKTEVAKSEILSVVEKENDLDILKQKCEKIYEDTTDYFASVMAQ